VAAPYLIGSFDSASFTGSSQAITITTAVNPGDAIAVVSAVSTIGAENLSSCTDSRSDTYNTHASNTTDVYSSYVTALCPLGLTTSQTITPTLAGALSGAAWTLAAFGIPSISSFDTGTSWTTGDSTSPLTGSLSNSPAGNTIMAFFLLDNVTSETPSSGYTQLGTDVSSSTGYNIFCNYKLNAATTEQPGCTIASNFWACVAAAFVPSVGIKGWGWQRKAAYGQPH
jgi:hypothetical protein